MMPALRHLSALLLAMACASALAAPVDFPTDRVIVRLKGAKAASAGVPERAVLATRLSATFGNTVIAHRVMGDGAQVMRLARPMAPSEIERLAQSLQGDNEIAQISPDRIAFPQFVPSDLTTAPHWALQGPQGINAPAAWDITRGNASTVIAIIDTGYLDHAEFTGRWLAGYDFVDATRANDGGGRDNDAHDPGDWVTPAESASGPLQGCPVTNSRWHGTAMAGVIAAGADNAPALGMVGVNHFAKLLPVRVVGKCGGYTSDIADGMRWAAGLAVPGVPANTTAAKVLNVSLAANSPSCDPAFQSAIDAVSAAGAIIVVSAGNAGADANQYAPGNCTGVITVGASDVNGGRPSYGNTGSTLALSAPGGVGATSITAVTTTFDGGTTTALNNSTYATQFGTSIAAAHVSGVASLLVAMRPTLSPAQVKSILANTSRGFPANAVASGSFANCTPALCGAGLLDAARAVTVLQDPDIGKPDIAAGTAHTIALRDDGRLFAWGRNTSGQVGDGTLVDRPHPVLITAIDGVTRIAGGGAHTLVTRFDGTVWAWGANDEGQLGNGTIDTQPTPQAVKVANLTDVIAIAGGIQHSLAVTRDGTVWGWGLNNLGQLGLPQSQSQATPVALPGFSGAVTVAAGRKHSCAMKGDGTVWCWGDLRELGSTLGAFTPPVQVAVPAISALSVGTDATHRAFAIPNLGPGAVGTNAFGELGVTAGAPRFPTAAAGGMPAPNVNLVQLGAGGNFTLALDDGGTVYGSGDNSEGELGRGTIPGDATQAIQQAFQVLPTLRQVVRIAAGARRGFALRADGSVVAWGAGFLGNGIETLRGDPMPVRVSGPGGLGSLQLGATAPAGNSGFSPGFIEAQDVAPGSVQTSNVVAVALPFGPINVDISNGQISVGCSTTFATTASVSPGTTACLRGTAPAALGATTVVTASVFGVTAGEYMVSTVPVDAIPQRFWFTPVTGAAVSTVVTSAPVLITGLNTGAGISITPGTASYSLNCTGTFTSLAGTIANGQTVCVRLTTGTITGGTTAATLTVGGVASEFRVTTARLPNSHNPPTIGATGLTAWAVAGDGRVIVWGDGREGMRGDGSNTPDNFRTEPSVVPGIMARSVAMGWGHALAVGTDSSIWSWGRNDLGQAADGTVQRDRVQPWPTRVKNVSGGMFTVLAAGATHSAASGFVWGDNLASQLSAACPGARCATPVIPAAPSGTIYAAGNTTYSMGTQVSCWGRCYTTNGYITYTTPEEWRGADPGLTNQTRALSTTGEHWLSIKTDKTVWAWGQNHFGQLGNGTTAQTSLPVFPPVRVGSLTNVMAVAAGGYHSAGDTLTGFQAHSLALKEDGTVWAWGDNSLGQLGVSGVTISNVPLQVPNLTGVVGIAAGWGTSFALKPDGTVVSWGKNKVGARGNGNFDEITFTPTPVLGVGGMGTLNVGVQDPAQFAPQTDVPLGSVRVSNAIFAGISGAISINSGIAEYSIGCNGTFVATAGTITSGQSVCMRLAAAQTSSTTVSATLRIGASTLRTFSVTTSAVDTLPDVFRFVPRAGLAPGSQQVSQAVQITGIAGPAQITVTNGEYGIGCTNFTAMPGTVNNNDLVCVRANAAGAPDALNFAILTVGGYSTEFDLMTSPVPAFTTPPQVSADDSGYGLRSDGRLFAWGSNAFGQLGIGDFQFRITPVRVDSLSGVKAIAGTQSHALALRTDGTVWAWGRNLDGELGDGSNVNAEFPIRVRGLPQAATAVAGSDSHSIALLIDKTVWTWGNNAAGQLGNGTQITSRVPVAAQITNVKAIAAGLAASYALKEDGSVWCWGQCQDSGLAVIQVTPAAIPTLANITAFSVNGSGAHGLAIRSDGAVIAWGRNSEGQIGTGSTLPASIFPPVVVPGLTGATSVSAGQFHSLVRTFNAGDAAVWSWGDNRYGQLGQGTSPTDGTALVRPTPTRLLPLDGSLAVEGGRFHSLVLKPDGTVFAFGQESGGNLGNGSNAFFSQQSIPARVLGVDGDGYLSLQFRDDSPNPFALVPRFDAEPSQPATSNAVVVTGLSVPSAISVSGGTYSIGCGAAYTAAAGTISNGQSVCVRVTAPGTFEAQASATLTIGSSSPQSSTFFVRTRRATSAAAVAPQVALGTSHTVVVTAAGKVHGLGYNANGQLGNGTTLNTPTALPAAGLAGVAEIAAGAYHTLALRTNGTVVSWGFNATGQLGINSGDPSRAYPSDVAGLTNVVSVAAGDYHSIALRGDGSVWAWGFNFYGQVGDNTTITRSVPVAVSGLANVVAIAAGGQHSLALLANGTVMAWGSNDSGQLGEGTTIARKVPVAVTGLTTVIALAAGASHSLALKANGSVVSWGANANGQLGDGTTTSRTSPVAVTSLAIGVGLIAAGGNHSLAVKAGGALFAWGANANGQLGDGLSANRSTPFQLTTPASVSAIGAGARHSAGIDTSGKLYVWGDNFFGQVGNRSGNFNPHAAGLNVLRGDSKISTGDEGSGGGGGTPSSSGSALILINGLATGYQFGPLGTGVAASAPGKIRNQSPTDAIGALAISASGQGFGVSAPCAATLAPNGECAFTLSFLAAAAGNYAGSLRFDSNLVGAPEFRSLEAIVTAPASPALTIASSVAQFAPTTVGTVAATQAVIVTNGGSAALVITGLASSAPDFGAVHDCGSVSPGSNCTVTVSFAPTGLGSFAGTLTIASNGGSQAITVTGTGVAAGYDSIPNAFSFASQSNVAPGTLVTSAPATISGLGGATSISVSDGSYSIGCTTTFTTAAGTIGNGQTVCVRHVAALTASTLTTTTLNVGGVVGTFSSTTNTASLDPAGDADGDGMPNGVELLELRNPFVKDNDVFASNRLFAMQQYRDFLGREGDAGGITAWVNYLNGGGTRAAVSEAFFGSPEFQGTGAPVVRLYFAYFLRIPDYAGLTFWMNYFRTGHTLVEISNAFAGSQEFLDRYGALTNSAFVDLVYQNVLGRPADAEGKAFWLGQLNAGMSRGQMMIGFSDSAEYQSTIFTEAYVTMMYVGMLKRAPDPGGFTFWVNYIDTGNSGQALIGGFLAAPEYRARFLP